MRKSVIVAVVLAGLVQEGFSESLQRPVALTRAVIVDGNGGPPVENGVLVVRGDRIEAVGPADQVEIPVEAEIKDLAGAALLPGLADMHVHLAHGWDGKSYDLLHYQQYLNGFLYSGVTTVLDTGNVLDFIVQLRDEVKEGRLTGPRIYCAGPLVDGPDAHWPSISYAVSSVEQIPGLVGRLKKGRVDIVKAYTGLSDTMLSTLVRESQKEGLTVLVDQGWRNGSVELVMADGVTAFAHAPDFPVAPDSIKLMKARGVKYITTLSVIEFQARRRLADLGFLDSTLIKDTTPAGTLAKVAGEARRELDTSGLSSMKHNTQRLAMREANIKKLFDAGILLAAGTDAPYPGVFQGEGIHRELELLVEAGLLPLEAITLATRNAAQLIGSESEWGTLEPGKLANILIIKGRPDKQIQDTRNIEAVMLLGKMLDRQQLKLQ
jgi:imidazolonepropionase-like amidohydrolase